ncbi:polyprenyl synthetase family protein [Lactobacillus sp. Sy-1]|uniref:polyprenyl synthetase family protein n=1 Tax=Lactobacillus sp. Sy-1 TaxID=2109645 RepID=UPI001C5905AD|nr:farnesyl diphosphate synthase [Lactobacillus sp. Sy-1]MBW1605640.1 polyprenyl synthetase family protein [Lactobacillus sp. Sy-1]
MGIDNQLATFENQFKPLINTLLVEQLPNDVDQPELADSMLYSVAAGGKRLRPLLTIAVIQTLSGQVAPSQMKAACAVELLHTYSLIHDDLPAMDNDDLRRGKPTNHVKFGAGMATLAGDGLLTLAFQWLVDNSLPAQTKVNLVTALSRLAGPAGMVAGQADDINFENHQLGLAELKRLHRHKTGDLILYAVTAGMLITDNLAYKAELTQFADAFGLAFQIYDDILDVTSSAEHLGKPVHQDAVKNTYPNLMGLDRSYQELETTIQNGQAALARMQDENQVDVSLLSAFFSYFQF